MCDDFGFSDDPFKVVDMHNEFGRSTNSKRDGFSVASNATATTRSTCSSQESSSRQLKGSSSGGSKSVSASSSRRRAAGCPPRTTSSREGPPPRTGSREGGGGGSTTSRSSRDGSSASTNKTSSAAGAADFESSFGSNAFGSIAFADFSEPFGSTMQASNIATAPAPAPAPAATAAAPKQRARRRASVACGAPTTTLPAVADPVTAEPQTRRRSPPDRQRSRSGERSTASSSGDSRRAGGRRTATRRASNGDGGSDGGLSRAKSTPDFGFDVMANNSLAAGLDMFGGSFGGGGSPTGAADYGYGDDATQATADFGYGDHQTVSEGMDYGRGDDDDAHTKNKELPRAKLSRGRRSSIGVTQFGGSSDAFINNLCQTNTRDLMSEKDIEKPKPKPSAGGVGGPSMIAMPLAGESPAASKMGIGAIGAGARRGGGRRASLIGGMNVGVGLVTNKLAHQAGEKLDDPDSARKNKASFFKDRSGGGDNKAKGAPSTATRSKSAGDSSMSSYNPDRDRRQMMKD